MRIRRRQTLALPTRTYKRIQLVLDPKLYKTQRKLVGQRVVAEGTLFGAHTAHHRTDVLLTVRTLAKAE